MTRFSTSRLLLLTLSFWPSVAFVDIPAQAQHPPAGGEPMLALLQQMVAEDPGRADSWRLIGRIFRQRNRTPEAIDAFRRALSIQPDNAAAHADLGDLLAQLGDHPAASHHFDQVMLLAPGSSYAASLVERGIRPAPRMAPEYVSQQANGIPATFAGGDITGSARQFDIDATGDVSPVGYEIQTFDGADDLDRRLNQLKADEGPGSLRAFIEFGALYNTNIALTPISRELTGNQSASFQGFLSPDLEWHAIQLDAFRSGPLLRGYFTVNEDNFRSLNLASFQPGAFIERDMPWGADSAIGRIDYVYSLDLLDGARFGSRHAATASLTTILPGADVVYTYLTASYSDFANDGLDPSVESLDGPSITAGCSRFFTTQSTWIPIWTLGADFEAADTEGADYRYEAVTLHGDVTIQLTTYLSFSPRFGVGYRSYGDFTGPVNRDELTGRLSGKLRWQWTETLAISAIVGHDRFASANENFDTERTEAGLVATVIR